MAVMGWHGRGACGPVQNPGIENLHGSRMGICQISDPVRDAVAISISCVSRTCLSRPAADPCPAVVVVVVVPYCRLFSRRGVSARSCALSDSGSSPTAETRHTTHDTHGTYTIHLIHPTVTHLSTDTQTPRVSWALLLPTKTHVRATCCAAC